MVSLRIPFHGFGLNFNFEKGCEVHTKHGPNMADRRWPAWVAALAAVAVGWCAIEAQNPPSPRLAFKVTDQFAAAYAQKHVEAIARAPHPMGSAESARVRKTIIKRLQQIGVTAEVQSTKGHDEPAPQNILARIKGLGRPGKKALMLCAHYDSVPSGPGASDNAAGVAVVLETLRALRQSPPLERDLIVLFTDGEESGLLGAHLFVDEHPWAKEVGLVINFDARGNSGPSILFETSDGNGWLISQYAQAVREPLATSVTMDVYKIMPNDSDMTVFKNAGMAGLNFAFGSGLAYYHTPDDTPENLDQRTLQHHGNNALATASHFGSLDLDNPQQDDVIYTSVLNSFVLFYSKTWILPLALVASGIFLVLVIVSIRTARMDLGDLFAGTVLFGCEIIASILAVGSLCLVGVCSNVVQNILHTSPIPWLKYDVLIMTVFALISAAITVAWTRWRATSHPLEGMILGAFSWWLGLSLATAIYVPGASYLFVWPTLGGLLGLTLAKLSPAGSPLASAVSLLGSIPALLLVAPLLRTTFDGLSLPMAVPITVCVVLFTGVLIPLWGPLIQPKPERQLTPERQESAHRQVALEHAS
jgi:Peptidase family M28